MLRDVCFPYKLVILGVSDGDLNGKQRGNTISRCHFNLEMLTDECGFAS